MADSKVSVTITRKANGTQPPLFVAGTFSSPQWVPQSMDYVTGEDGEPTFSKTFQVEPGSKIQYKFRVGEGDWWVLNEDAPTVTDDSGNRNNIIESPPLAEDHSSAQPSTTIENSSLQQDQNIIHQSKPAGRVGELALPGEIERAETPESSRVAAEVADSAALLDRSTPEPETFAKATGEAVQEAPTSAHIQEVSNTAAEVADTAAALDADEPIAQLEEPPATYKALADVKPDIKDDSLEIAGYSNEPEPVALFAHECAGLYEDDEIPGADDTSLSRKTNGRLRTHDEEDFDDPTLERFPLTRDEIISTVRNVETGLNEDRTSISGVPPSPLFRSTDAATASSRNDLDDRDLSLNSDKPLNLQVPPSPGQKPVGERSLSVASLGSIAEGAEGEEEKSKVSDIAPVVEQVTTANSAIEVAKNAEGEASATASKPSLEPLVTVPSPSVQAENGMLSPASNEDEAVVLKSAKGKGESTETGYLTPERAATPKPEEPGSPREPPPNRSPPVTEQETDPETYTGPTAPTSAPKSPRILVSKADDSDQEENLLPDQSLDPSSKDNGIATIDSGKSDMPSAVEDDQADEEPVSPPSTSRGLGSGSDAVASSTAVEGNQGGSLKKRSGGHKSPTDRAATPSSISGPSRDAAKSGNWFSAFFRLIFVDIVGGIVSRLCGGRRKALVTTTVVILAAVGFASYRKVKLSDFLVDVGTPW